VANQKLLQLLQVKQEYFYEIADQIWNFAEVRYQEKKSSALQMEVLRELGFDITPGWGGVATSFKAEWRQGDGPVIGFLGEYDALDGLSQQAGCMEKNPVEGMESGHGCGHNLLGVAAMKAAVAMKEYMEAEGLQGTVCYFGCAAEEEGAGKVFMLREGAFDGLDACFSWHPFDFNSSAFTTLAMVRVLFDFKGVSAHAAAAPHKGRSALTAVELMNVGVSFIREHLPPEGRVHYAITNSGGDAANIIQADAQVLYNIRAPRLGQTKEMFRRIVKIAEGAAIMTETEMSMRILSGYANMLENPPLAAAVEKHLAEVMPLELTEEEREFVRAYMPAIDQEEPMQGEIDGPVALAISTDAGDVSWVVPTAAPAVVCYPRGTALHTWQVTAMGKGGAARKGMNAAAYTMAASALDVLQDPKLLAAAKAALVEARCGEVYETMIPAHVKPGES